MWLFRERRSSIVIEDDSWNATLMAVSSSKIAAIATTVLAAIFVLISALPSNAQSQAEDTATLAQPAFEVASIRPVVSDGFASMVTINFEGDRYIASNCTLQMLIKEAYGVDDYRITGGPEWINSARYEIEARMDNKTYSALQQLGYDELKLAHRHMLQALLADRFKLSIHHETKTLPLYSLVIAKNGFKLHEAKPGETYVNGARDPGGVPLGPHTVGNRSSLDHSEWIVVLTGQAASTEILASAIRVYLGRTIVDNTGLTGSYDFQLTFNWPFDGGESVKQQPDNDIPPQYSERTLFDAFQQQLGLKLEPRKGPAEVLIIDHIEKPSEN